MLELPELGRLSDTALTRDAEIVLSDKGYRASKVSTIAAATVI
jgi:hypothetical protein